MTEILTKRKDEVIAMTIDEFEEFLSSGIKESEPKCAEEYLQTQISKKKY